ncbi:hypothetical protein MRB53_016576 [Persea americana]|uniref:Uncharacterized protein n=1 Tax=Persea americana TaxID=3435 RepID=A0ACC2M2A5_PERAE|nr:hypothetical protein MRB53_016576 [Persea americana]
MSCFLSTLHPTRTSPIPTSLKICDAATLSSFNPLRNRQSSDAAMVGAAMVGAAIKSSAACCTDQEGGALLTAGDAHAVAKNPPIGSEVGAALGVFGPLVAVADDGLVDGDPALTRMITDLG